MCMDVAPPHHTASSLSVCPLQTIDDSLRQVFQFFAAYGDRQNKTTLSDFKFNKLIKHAEVTVRCTPPALNVAVQSSS